VKKAWLIVHRLVSAQNSYGTSLIQAWTSADQNQELDYFKLIISLNQMRVYLLFVDMSVKWAIKHLQL